jgi:hypothetical protein
MRVTLFLATAVTVVAALSFSAGPAAATQTVGETAKASAPHCVITGTVQTRGEAPTTTPPPISCYSTFAKAVSAATAGEVQLPADATRVTQKQLDAGKAAARASGKVASTTASVMIGVEYKDKNLGGATRLMNSNGACTANGYTPFPSLAPYGWNNTIGSAVTYSGCLAGHFQYDNFGGPSIVCNCYSNLGALNDLTSSIWFSATGR